jgi:hypothetical protein
MAKYAQDKATNPFTAKDSYYTHPRGTESDPNRSLLPGCEVPSNNWSGVLGPAASGSSQMIQDESWD